MVGPEIVCLSTVHTERQVPEEADTISGERDDNVSSILAKPDMVPKPAESANRSSSFATRPKRDPHESPTRILPSGGAGQLLPSRLQSVRSNMQDGGISEESFKIISAAWRRGTEKAYSSAWGKWILWCNKQESNPFSSSVGPVVNFLTEEFKHGKQHTTMNSY